MCVYARTLHLYITTAALCKYAQDLTHTRTHTHIHLTYIYKRARNIIIVNLSGHDSAMPRGLDFAVPVPIDYNNIYNMLLSYCS